MATSDEQREAPTLRMIEICFPVAVDLPHGWEQRLDALVDEVCEAYEKANPGRIMWPAGYGSKPQWSRVDAAILGKEAGADAPESGEPTFDDSVYQIDVAEREAYESEIGRREKRKAAQQAPQERADDPWRELFYRAALASNCLYSTFVDANEHVIEKIALAANPQQITGNVAQPSRDTQADAEASVGRARQQSEVAGSSPAVAHPNPQQSNGAVEKPTKEPDAAIGASQVPEGVANAERSAMQLCPTTNPQQIMGESDVCAGGQEQSPRRAGASQVAHPNPQQIASETKDPE